MARQKQLRVSDSVETPTEDNVNNKIALDDLIPVMSLIDYPLNLMQQNNGRAKYRFDKFGMTKQLLYQDVLVILENYMHFLENGFFIILDKRVVARHGLQEVFSKILSKEQIEKILDGSKDALKLYQGCSPEQQKKIIGMVTRKLVDNLDSMDMNLVNSLSRLSGVNILENAEDSIANSKREDEK
jgi:hypothetical protein